MSDIPAAPKGGVTPATKRVMNLAHFLTASARRHGGEIGFVWGERTWLWAEIDARATSGPEDCRVDGGRARVRKARLPREVARGLRSLLSRLGLRYAAVDLRRTDEGAHLFLEVNPSGQFLFVERRTGHPVAEALCDLLVRG